MNDAPELWSSKDIAAYLQKSPKTISRHLINEPNFPEPVRGSARPYYFRKDEVLDYLFNRDGRQARRR